MKNIRARVEGFLSRLERAEAVLLEGRVHRVEGMPHTYVVRGSENYLVDLEKEICTCPDHMAVAKASLGKGHTCKHLLAAVLLERGEKKAVQRSNEAAKAA